MCIQHHFDIAYFIVYCIVSQTQNTEVIEPRTGGRRKKRKEVRQICTLCGNIGARYDKQCTRWTIKKHIYLKFTCI